MIYEHRRQPPLSRKLFLRRLASHFGVSVTVVAGSILLGMVGYRAFEGLSWTDGFLNAAMLLGGMGPVDSPRSEGGKIFAGCYALYAGLVFLVAAAIILAPVFHRILHKLHWDEGND
ncbi:MAG TPA: hypothetical protein VF021_12580 [Longimicrobiales bacterium]